MRGWRGIKLAGFRNRKRKGEGMKTESEIIAGEKRLVQRLTTPGLSSEQKALVVGMINSMNWVLENEHGTSTERMMRDEPIAIGVDHEPTMRLLDAVIEKVKGA